MKSQNNLNSAGAGNAADSISNGSIVDILPSFLLSYPGTVMLASMGYDITPEEALKRINELPDTWDFSLFMEEGTLYLDFFPKDPENKYIYFTLLNRKR